MDPHIIQRLQRASEGKESLDLNQVIEELGPMMTQKEIDAMKSGQTGQYYELHVPNGWTPPTEEQQKQVIQKDDAANQKAPERGL